MNRRDILQAALLLGSTALLPLNANAQTAKAAKKPWSSSRIPTRSARC